VLAQKGHTVFVLKNEVIPVRRFRELYEETVATDPAAVAKGKRWVAAQFYEPDSEQYQKLMRDADELDRLASLNLAGTNNE
jgi:hypothetical protein